MPGAVTADVVYTHVLSKKTISGGGAPGSFRISRDVSSQAPSQRRIH